MTTWDYTTDVLVAGSGGGGMTAPLDIVESLKCINPYSIAYSGEVNTSYILIDQEFRIMGLR